MNFIIFIALILLPLSDSFLTQFTAETRTEKCLLDYLSEMKSWVDETGALIVNNTGESRSVDISHKTVNPVSVLRAQIEVTRRIDGPSISYVSMAKCNLPRVPTVFNFRDVQGRALRETVEYLTFYGNYFSDALGEPYDTMLNATDAMMLDQKTVGLGSRGVVNWSDGFEGVTFPRLREVDLRKCRIATLKTDAFNGMRRLEALYISQNNIHMIYGDAFKGLVNLRHLDMSRNHYDNAEERLRLMMLETTDIFQNLPNLESMDLSHTSLPQYAAESFKKLSKKFQTLSICATGLSNLPSRIFETTSIRFLDVSYNNSPMTNTDVLYGLEDTLQVLFAVRVGIKHVDYFYNFYKLEILRITDNEIDYFPAFIAVTMTNMQILDMNSNRLATWYNPIFSMMPNLKYFTATTNNINIISEEMMYDFEHLKYLGLSDNSVICQCLARELMEHAQRNERLKTDNDFIYPLNGSGTSYVNAFLGFDTYNSIIEGRKRVNFECNGDECDVELKTKGTFRLIDFENSKDYNCVEVSDRTHTEFHQVESCTALQRTTELDAIRDTTRFLYILALPALLLPFLAVGFIFRRNFRYCFITMRNSAMLSLINKEDTIDTDEQIFNYDVFVSYCNEDRQWVLDHLLPHVENKCSVSVCLHERDFQVGLSILQNIVSCMDRSRSIMLVLSRKFLLSQWCQFEMHLAQHRLLETRREDLILVLLEDIPRRMRPNTLHYLMLTKTYIVWPKEEKEREVFFRRLKKSLIYKRANDTSVA